MPKTRPAVKVDSTLKRVFEQGLDLIRFPPNLKVSEWADEYLYTKRGKFTCFPFQREPMDEALNPTVASIVLMWPSQVVGKTEVGNAVLEYHIHYDPCPMLMVQPTVEMGESWSKEKFMANVRATPALRGLIGEGSRQSGNTITHKEFPGGDLAIVGANSPAGLAMRDRRIVFLDEVDRYPESAGKEGDPVALAEKRTESYPDAIIYKSSTPTIDGMSRIQAEFHLSDKRYFVVPCFACGCLQTLKWAQVKWQQDHPETACYQCENCQETWSDEQRIMAIGDARAHWQATAPFCGIRGYHLNGLYCLWPAQKGYQNRLHQFAAQFLKANARGVAVLKAWTNTFLAECWVERGKDRDHVDLLARCENYPILPAKALFVVGAADVQEDRIELEKRAFGVGEESWGISYEVLMGNTEFDTVWEALLQSIQQQYHHPSGKDLSCALFFVDCAYRPKRVLSFVKRCQRRGLPVYACLGSKTRWDEKLVSRPTKSVKQKATWFKIGTDHAKITVFERLDVTEPGPRFMHFPVGRGYDEEYFKTLTAERLVLEYENNILKKREWRKKRDRNEALDINAYMLGAVDVLNPNWDALEKHLEIKGVAADSKASAEPEPQQTTKQNIFSRPMRRRGFIRTW